ncbi:MAG: hypothetical protein ACHQNE_00885 [Candidatus Kapaibacterium sp.]
MNAKQSPAKAMMGETSSVASGANESPILSDRVGIERAFEVIRHHTVHTKGYVATALQLIEEFGSAEDKALLADFLRQNGQAAEFAATQETAAKKKAGKRK